MTTKLNNHCNFPTILGGKLKIMTNQKNVVDLTHIDRDAIALIEEDSFRDRNLFFSGNSVVVESFRILSSFDMLLLLQIVEYHQKMKNSETTEHKEYKITLDQEDKDLYKNEIIVKCFDDINSEEYEKANSIENEDEQREYVLNLIQKKADEQNRKKFDMYAISRENYCIKIDVAELLKQRGLRNQIENRAVIKNSLLNLFNTSLAFYFFKDSVSEKIKEAKKGRKYIEWKEDVKDIFFKNKIRSKTFYRHIVEAIDIDQEINTITIQINKGFLDYCEESRHFDYSHLFELNLNSAKTFFINSSFAYKEILSKEYIFDIMDLRFKENCKNLKKANEAIAELIEIGFLTKESRYDKSTGNFHIFQKREEVVKKPIFKKNKKVSK